MASNPKLVFQSNNISFSLSIMLVYLAEFHSNTDVAGVGTLPPLLMMMMKIMVMIIYIPYGRPHFSMKAPRATSQTMHYSILPIRNKKVLLASNLIFILFTKIVIIHVIGVPQHKRFEYHSNLDFK